MTVLALQKLKDVCKLHPGASKYSFKCMYLVSGRIESYRFVQYLLG